MAEDIFDTHLLSFACNYSTYMGIDDQNAIAMIKDAARSVYTSDKYKRRGEFGELLLHAVLRDVFESEPAVSKIWFKDSNNDTVKGFDAVHVVAAASDFELWLGEVKFYTDVRRAIRDVVDELHAHLEDGYLRGEFVFLCRKIDDTWPYAQRFRDLVHKNKSLDQIFPALTIPVVLTYNSKAVRENDTLSDDYLEQIRAEAEAAWSYLVERVDVTWNVRLRLILMPLRDKAALGENLHRRLTKWQ